MGKECSLRPQIFYNNSIRRTPISAADDLRGETQATGEFIADDGKALGNFVIGTTEHKFDAFKSNVPKSKTRKSSNLL